MDTAEHMARYGRPGFAWRGITIATWIAVTLSVAVIAISSRAIGRSVWWLGAPTKESPWYYMILVLVIVTAPIEGALWRSRSVLPTTVACSLGLVAIAIPDFSRSPGCAAAMCVVAFAALLQSIALVVVNRQYR